MTRTVKPVLLGYAPFCGRCRNPFGIIQDGTALEVGPPTRAFGEEPPATRLRALCSGWNAGSHDVWGYQ